MAAPLFERGYDQQKAQKLGIPFDVFIENTTFRDATASDTARLLRLQELCSLAPQYAMARGAFTGQYQQAINEYYYGPTLRRATTVFYRLPDEVDALVPQAIKYNNGHVTLQLGFGLGVDDQNAHQAELADGTPLLMDFSLLNYFGRRPPVEVNHLKIPEEIRRTEVILPIVTETGFGGIQVWIMPPAMAELTCPMPQTAS